MKNAVVIAIEKAKQYVDEALKVQNTRAKLEKLSKKELIDKLLELQPDSRPKIKDIVYTILEDPDCAWLTWDVIAKIINKSIASSKTSPDSLRWYPSAATKEGKVIIPRKKAKEITQELLNSN